MTAKRNRLLMLAGKTLALAVLLALVMTPLMARASVTEAWEFRRRVAPTCTERGYDVYYNFLTNQSENRNYTAALGHDWSDWMGDMLPTCTEGATSFRVCNRCYQAEYRDFAALGHSYGEWKVNEKPICEKQGLDVRYCTRCGDDE